MYLFITECAAVYVQLLIVVVSDYIACAYVGY